jgi:hypothetical protein
VQKYLSITDLAKRWGCLRQHAARILDRGDVPSIEIAGRRVVPADKAPLKMPVRATGRPRKLKATAIRKKKSRPRRQKKS